MSIVEVIGILLLAGLLLWIVSAIPKIDASIKRIIHIIIIALVLIWLIGLFFGVNFGSLGRIRVGR